jgi:hypothetical protein
MGRINYSLCLFNKDDIDLVLNADYPLDIT